MKKVYIIILVAVIAVGGVIGGVLLIGGRGKYDQSTPVGTAKSFVTAMLDGDSEAFGKLTKDIMPWTYLESDFLNYATQNMGGYGIDDYYYYQEGTAVVIYNKTAMPAPETRDFFCMDFVKADGKYYIIDLSLPGYVRGWHSVTKDYDWNSYCKDAIENGGVRFE